MMVESLGRPRLPPRGAGQDAARRLATLEAAGELQIPFTTGRPGRHRRGPAADRRRARGDRRVPASVTATCRRSSSRTSCRRPAPPCTRAPACPPDEYLQAVAAGPARPSPGGPPPGAAEPERRLRPLLDAGIDDWGGVSPVTARPREPRAAVAGGRRLREVTEARGFTLAPRLTLYPEHVLDPGRWLDPGCPASPCSIVRRRGGSGGMTGWSPADPGDGRRRPGAVGGADRPSQPVVLGRRRRPAPVVPTAGRGGHGPGAARCWTACARLRRSAIDEIATLFTARGPEVAAVAGGGRRAAPRRAVGDAVTCVAQPEHQLHERVHVQVPVLRVLQGTALAQPARQRRTCSPSRTSRRGRRGGRPRRHRGVPAGRHPPRLRRRLLHRRLPGGAGGGARHPRPRLHRRSR